jgi:2-deoxy-D-gluconate 3-dehydrogenase
LYHVESRRAILADVCAAHGVSTKMRAESMLIIGAKCAGPWTSQLTTRLDSTRILRLGAKYIGWRLKTMSQSIADLFDLTGKGTIVTGGAAGIGQAVVFRLAEAGAGVMVADIDLQTASETVREVEASGGMARAIQADVRSPADARKVVQATVEAFGRLDILVNNAAVYPFSSVFEMTEETWDRVLDTNLKGAFFFAQAAAQTMVEAGRGGRILNLASMNSLHPTRIYLTHYDSSKGGIAMLTKSLALELAPHNILVNAVVPGGIMTPGGLVQATSLEARGESLEEQTEAFVSRVPLGRVGEPDDVAKVVLFLASAAADYMTGSLVVADGGFLIS